jgi:hypothetical protein
VEENKKWAVAAFKRSRSSSKRISFSLFFLGGSGVEEGSVVVLC